MYAKLTFLLLIIVSSSKISFAEDTFYTGDTTIQQKYFLDMKGRVLFGKKGLSQAWVKIYHDSSNSIVQKMESDNEGYLAFQLPINKNYVMKVSKPGYVTKIITIDTRMPRSQQNSDYPFEFTIDLFESIEGLDVSMLREPVAKIFFNSFNKNFDYDANYTAKINNDLKKLYADYKIQKKQGKAQLFTPAANEPETVQKSVPDTLQKPSEPKTTFSVEILSSDEQVQRNSPRFKGMINVKEYQENGIYKYYVGDYPTQKDAEKMKDNISGYFPGASIISFIDGKKANPSVGLPNDK